VPTTHTHGLHLMSLEWLRWAEGWRQLLAIRGSGEVGTGLKIQARHEQWGRWLQICKDSETSLYVLEHLSTRLFRFFWALVLVVSGRSLSAWVRVKVWGCNSLLSNLFEVWRDRTGKVLAGPLPEGLASLCIIVTTTYNIDTRSYGIEVARASLEGQVVQWCLCFKGPKCITR
jgi:hypothetical protein